jgi:hypothetical protein
MVAVVVEEVDLGEEVLVVFVRELVSDYEWLVLLKRFH